MCAVKNYINSQLEIFVSQWVPLLFWKMNYIL